MGYSHGVDVVGHVIELVSGMPLDVFLQRFVLRPVGMTHTTFSVSQDRAGDLAAMYKVERARARLGGRLVRVDGERPEESAWYGPARVLAGGGMMGSCAGG